MPSKNSDKELGEMRVQRYKLEIFSCRKLIRCTEHHLPYYNIQMWGKEESKSPARKAKQKAGRRLWEWTTNLEIPISRILCRLRNRGSVNLLSIYNATAEDIVQYLFPARGDSVTQFQSRGEGVITARDFHRRRFLPGSKFSHWESRVRCTFASLSEVRLQAPWGVCSIPEQIPLPWKIIIIMATMKVKKRLRA